MRETAALSPPAPDSLGKSKDEEIALGIAAADPWKVCHHAVDHLAIGRRIEPGKNTSHWNADFGGDARLVVHAKSLHIDLRDEFSIAP